MRCEPELPPPPGAAEQWGIQPRHAAWIESFVRVHGRAPRVLGIGNIANAAYKNALALRRHGIECDVLCYSYYHIMGCPEWESAYFDPRGIDDFKPDWSQVDLGGYQRPRWFVQGHFGTCLDYLIAFREGDPAADTLWRQLERERDSGGAGQPSARYYEPTPPCLAEAVAASLVQLFGKVFPNRRDTLDGDEAFARLGYFLGELPRIRRMLSHYDLVIGYSTDGILPLIAGKRNYIAYEHGTIRAIPFQRDVDGQLCALVYARANGVLITNCDNIVAAQRLGLRRLAFVPHPILEEWAGALRRDDLRKRLLDENDADFLVFHPPRQHWSAARDPNFDKGNDVLFRGFARFVAEIRPKALLMLVEWGQTVGESRALIDALGIAHRVIWLNPKPVRMLVEYVAAADVLADQFTIGAWGSTMPLGLLVGTPTLIRLDDAVHRWCFPDMPPVLNATTPDEVFAHLVAIQDPDRAAAMAAAGKAWFAQYHSMSVVAGRLVDAIAQVCGENGIADPDIAEEFSASEVSEKTVMHIQNTLLHQGLLENRIEYLVNEINFFHNYISGLEVRYAKLRAALAPAIWLGKRMRRVLRTRQPLLPSAVAGDAAAKASSSQHE